MFRAKSFGLFTRTAAPRLATIVKGIAMIANRKVTMRDLRTFGSFVIWM